MLLSARLIPFLFRGLILRSAQTLPDPLPHIGSDRSEIPFLQIGDRRRPNALQAVLHRRRGALDQVLEPVLDLRFICRHTGAHDGARRSVRRDVPAFKFAHCIVAKLTLQAVHDLPRELCEADFETCRAPLNVLRLHLGNQAVLFRKIQTNALILRIIAKGGTRLFRIAAAGALAGILLDRLHLRLTHEPLPFGKSQALACMTCIRTVGAAFTRRRTVSRRSSALDQRKKRLRPLNLLLSHQMILFGEGKTSIFIRRIVAISPAITDTPAISECCNRVLQGRRRNDRTRRRRRHRRRLGVRYEIVRHKKSRREDNHR